MKLQPLFSLLLISAVIAVVPAQSRPAEITSRYTKLTSCNQIGHGSHGEDWVSHKCKGYDGIPIWLTFADSTRAYVGFGRNPNVSGFFGTDRNDSWPIEWRGQHNGKRFVPVAVIIRMTEPHGGLKKLVVFRLRSDGTSCIVGGTEGSNIAARKIADDAMHKFACVSGLQSH